jgi:hypothetical protein
MKGFELHPRLAAERERLADSYNHAVTTRERT